MILLLGIDAGTTSVKAGLFSPDGRCLGISRQEYQLETPATDRAQLDPEVYWQACQQAVREALAQSGAEPEQVQALAVSSQGETTITLDEHGNAIYPALVWLDNRATEQAAFLTERFNGDVYTQTGIPEILPTWSACKIMWIRQNEPEVFSRAHKFVLVQDFLIYKLTGQIVTDGSIACTTLNYDLIRNVWWEEVQEAIGIRTTQLPDIVCPGTIVGTLTSEAAGKLGLTVKTFVVTGGMDQSVGAIGAGNIKPGIVSEATGAALAIQATLIDPMIDQSKVVPVYCHSVPGKFLFVPVCPTAGIALKWLRDTFFMDEIEKARKEKVDPYDRLTRLALEIPPGADGLVMLPHLMGAFSPLPNAAARGTYTGFTLSHTRGHFVRALLEGVAFMLKQNLEFIEQTGMEVCEVRSMGGGSRSALWNQIKANVCKRPVLTLANEETGLIGDAIIAGTAIGIFKSIAEGCLTMVTIKEVIQPDDQADAYAQPYKLYCELDRQLAGYFNHAYIKIAK
jgi:sugar (pentulose or hexulose) kinase